MKPYTDKYKNQLVEMHETTGWGGGGHKRAVAVNEVATAYGCQTVLDYGCGKGTLKTALVERFGWTPELIREYDPGIPGKDMQPTPADLVACTDVLEHVEPHLVGEICRHLWLMSVKVAYVLIVKQLSGKILPDGRNAHLTIGNTDFWVKQLHDAGFRQTIILRDDPKTLILECKP